MAFVYAVRCNFTRPEAEAAWNAWYDGPKLTSLLSKPMFLAGQRFVATGLDRRRKYLALWYVESPRAFETPEYKADWGFAEWAPHIGDWSRDLYRAPDGDLEAAFGARPGQEALHLVSFEGLDAAAAGAALAAVRPSRPGVQWLDAVGLDRHSPRLGLARRPSGWRPDAPLDHADVSETMFAPRFPFTRRPA